jgi:hypothetical protein
MESDDEGRPVVVSMAEVAADFGEEDGELDEADRALLQDLSLEQDSCFFRTCVFACSDVAVSASRVKVRHRRLVAFPPMQALGVERPELVTVLDLSHNLLVSLPAAVGQLVGMRRLHADHNRIVTVDAALFGLSELEHLTLSHNRLACLGRELLQMELQTLDLSHNPLGWPPAELSAHELRAWAHKYQAPRSYRSLGEQRRFVDASYRCVYYLGPGDKDEDRHEIVVPVAAEQEGRSHDSNVLARPEYLFFGIYDGHCGHMVSAALQQNFHKKLLEGGCFAAGTPSEELRTRIRNVYLDTDARLCEILRGEKTSKKRKPGSCCTAVWIVGTRLVVSHVGDSRVIMW